MDKLVFVFQFFRKYGEVGIRKRLLSGNVLRLDWAISGAVRPDACPKGRHMVVSHIIKARQVVPRTVLPPLVASGRACQTSNA